MKNPSGKVSKQDTERLHEQIEALERINDEQRQTIEMMEENSVRASETIESIKARADQKEKEIQQLKKAMNEALGNANEKYQLLCG